MKMLKKALSKQMFVLLAVAIFVAGIFIGRVTSNRQSTVIKNDEEVGKTVTPDADYSISWSSSLPMLKISQKEAILAEFWFDYRPLAIWLKPLTKTMVIVASKDGAIDTNQTIFVYRNGELRKLYEATSGFKDGVRFNGRFYNSKARPDVADEMYLTPNEELLLAREYEDQGYYPKVFNLDGNRLTNYRNTWEPIDTYWSPSGRCFVHWGNKGQSEFGFFFKPDDFISYSLHDDTDNRSQISVLWESENPCRGYITMTADEVAGMDPTRYENKQYVYQFGEIAGHLREVPTLPKNGSSLSESVQPKLKLIYVTYPISSDANR